MTSLLLKFSEVRIKSQYILLQISNKNEKVIRKTKGKKNVVPVVQRLLYETLTVT